MTAEATEWHGKWHGMEVTNARGERQARWLLQQYGAERVEAAVVAIRGTRRRTYPLNVARQLQVDLPRDLDVTPAQDAEPHLDRLYAMIGRRRRRKPPTTE